MPTVFLSESFMLGDHGRQHGTIRGVVGNPANALGGVERNGGRQARVSLLSTGAGSRAEPYDVVCDVLAPDVLASVPLTWRGTRSCILVLACVFIAMVVSENAAMRPVSAVGLRWG